MNFHLKKQLMLNQNLTNEQTMGYAIFRERRNHPIITKASKLFSKYIENGDYEKAAMISCWVVLQLFAKEGIMNTLNNANSFLKRRSLRRGL